MKWIGLDVNQALKDAEREREAVSRFWQVVLVVAIAVACSTAVWFDARFSGTAQTPGVVNIER